MVLAGFDLDISEADLRELCDCTAFGADALQAVDAARQLGFPHAAKFNLSLEELESLVAAGHFPIVFVNLLPLDGLDDAHTLVVIEVNPTDVLVYDPMTGERVIQRESFAAAWAIMRGLTILLEP